MSDRPQTFFTDKKQAKDQTFCYRVFKNNDIGPVLLVWNRLGRITGLAFVENEEAVQEWVTHYGQQWKAHLKPSKLTPVSPDELKEALKAFYLGERPRGLELELYGSPLELKVWQALQEISSGETSNYSQIAKWAKVPKAERAVASAIGRNPIAVFIPCHRVIRKDGSLGGYAGGLDMKKKLLSIEDATV